MLYLIVLDHLLCHRNVSDELLERTDSRRRGGLPITSRGQWEKATHDVQWFTSRATTNPLHV